MKPGGQFYFDACTIGDKNVALFREQARMYRDDPTRIRGLLNYCGPELINRLAREAGLHPDTLTLAHEFWMRVMVTKIAAPALAP